MSVTTNDTLGFDIKIGILDPDGKNLNPLTNKPYSDTYKKWARMWTAFPAYEQAEKVLDSIHHNQLNFIISGTGSGKTVLVPKYALHYTNYEGKVAITLPKRSATASSATFAAATLDVELGKDVGYRHKGSPPGMERPENRIVYMTDGLLVSKFTKDPMLSEYKVVIVDEAHERKVQIDMILLFLKQLLQSGKRPDLRVIIMSATIDGVKYQKYFSGIQSKIINISGQPNYEIDVHYLDQPSGSYLTDGAELIDNLIKKGLKQDLLFFITTSNEAMQLCRGVRSKYPKIFCIEAFSEMNQNLRLYVESRDKFHELGDYDFKLIMATNVAESSITIDGLKYVIDSCYELFSYFDPTTATNVLEKRMITKAQALQRRGRVGRTEPGVCYHLLTKTQFDHLQEYPDPDIMKQDITIDLLKIVSVTPTKTYQEGHTVLKQLMDVPKQIYVDFATDLYDTYNLIDKSGKITRAGLEVIQYSSITLNRSLFLIYSYQLHCAKEASIILAMLDATSGKFQNLFYKKDTMCESGCINPKNMKPLVSKKGDHLTFLNIYQKFKEAADQKAWAKKYNIRLDVLNKADREFKMYYYKILNQSRAPKLTEDNLTGGAQPDMKAIKRRLLEALATSHQHLMARNQTPIYPYKKLTGQINKASSVHLHYNRRELAKKTFIYDEFMNINGSLEFSVITFVSTKNSS